MERAENGGLDPSSLDFAFLGCPAFLSRGPSGLEIREPQKRQSQPQPPILGPLILGLYVREGVCRKGGGGLGTKYFFQGRFSC